MGNDKFQPFFYGDFANISNGYAVGYDISGSIEQTLIYYTGDIDNLSIQSFEGIRWDLSISGDLMGITVGVGFFISEYNPDINGRFIGIKYFTGVGLPGIGGNFNKGETFVYSY